MRSFLTMLGMIIGVAAVITLSSLIQGFYNDMLDSYADMGLYNVSVTIYGRNGNKILTEADMYRYAREHADTIKGVTPTVPIQATIYKNGDKIETSTISGVDEYYTELVNKKVESGRTLSYSDISTMQRSCVIGCYVNQKLFKGKARPGDTLLLNGEPLTIVGILKPGSGKVEQATEWSSDNCLYIPYTTASRLFGYGTIGSYEFYIKDRSFVAAETDKLQKYLFNTFRDKKAFYIRNMVDMLNSIDTELAILTTMSSVIAGISLVVAGVGIMNIMLVSVSERIKEIGIRKSLGAKYRDIRRQFVLEAGLTSTLGGVLGIILGASLTSLFGNLAKIKAQPTTFSIILSFGVSVLIGVVFGYLPARKAAKLNPIDALRNE
jgi:putative ABC transport system permease protein